MENDVITERENCKANFKVLVIATIWNTKIMEKKLLWFTFHIVRDKFSHVFIIPSSSPAKSSAKLSTFHHFNKTKLS